MREKLSKYSVDPSTGCWNWTGATDKDGYGYLASATNGVRWSKKAHRASYEEFIGPIPEGEMVLHSCDNPPCINPAHLHLGDHKVNAQEMVERGRANPCRGVDHPNFGKRHSDETRKRMSEGVKRYLKRVHGK